MRILLLSLLMCIFTSAHAGYSANFEGKVTDVLTYPYGTLILIRVEGQPKTHTSCTKFDYPAIATDVSPESRQLVMPRLLLAYASGEKVNIGYDKNGGCVDGRIRIHRVG
ncbi:hypothetical protein [Marinagarivorans algicola]|uniref:hypothetical protein n=1 Tax=Marinagarivorans algicola TaxID=1513270 RepID=UPI0006B923B5|nr:hypothetical protein [Marinagarivorans algicola]